MPPLSPPFAIEKPHLGGDQGGLHPPGYGGGDSGPGDNFPEYERRFRLARLGLLLGVLSISILFLAVTVIFLLYQNGITFGAGRAVSVPSWPHVILPLRLLLVNTAVLFVSSLFMEQARRSVKREMALAPVRQIAGIALESERRVLWIGVTAALGFLFLAGQWSAWQEFRSAGFPADSGGAGPFFYILTGGHALHLAVGVIVLLYAGVISLLRRPVEQRRIVVEMAGWYWHYMGALWIYVFALLEFGR